MEEFAMDRFILKAPYGEFKEMFPDNAVEYFVS